MQTMRPAVARLAAALALALVLAARPCGSRHGALPTSASLPSSTPSRSSARSITATSRRTPRTATKTDTPLRDVPQSITVVTQDMIQDQAMQNLADVVRYVPGVGMAQGEGNRDTPVFRGNSSTADMFVDGMRDDAQYFRDLYNIERVEALKGPNAMIFGRGGAGGVLNRVTKQSPTGTPCANSTLQFGSWNKRRIAADCRPAASTTTSAFRVTGMFEDSESYRDGYEARALGHQPDLRAGASARTRRVTLGYEHFEDDRVADRGIPSSTTSFNGRRLPVETDPSTFFGDPERSPTWADVDAFSALVEHDFGNGVTLRNRTRVADYDKFYQNVYPGGPVTPTVAARCRPRSAPTTTRPSARTSSTRPTWSSSLGPATSSTRCWPAPSSAARKPTTCA